MAAQAASARSNTMSDRPAAEDVVADQAVGSDEGQSGPMLDGLIFALEQAKARHERLRAGTNHSGTPASARQRDQ